MDISDRQHSEAFQGSDWANLRLSLRPEGKAPRGRLSEMLSDGLEHMGNSSGG